MQRKYCRSVLNSKEKTYKGLNAWLNMNYQDGKPSVFLLQSAMEEDDALLNPDHVELISHSSPSYAPLVTPDDGTDDGSLQLSPRQAQGE
jgi:hypothetical protein